MQIGTAQQQLKQEGDNERPDTGRDLPIRDDNDSDLDDDDCVVLEPTRIIDTWARGRHTRYIICWSDGSITLNRTEEVERVAPVLLENYRREKRRLATQRTRENQRLGINPKIEGRGRGRGRGRRG